mmetsp:Transcript_83837/g.213461  ORF Transcript_83837/g.213461 Transcript_83837/m.213461 type:complete len:151 (+) Transcript_83837:48-500(+)|eukprot:CAMPEP_0183433300 /NCGR_PEP_ID=MMETSP0370-20130417/61304_1 /TAXON_ID=268820 /ORGANISM="Peridinium aciculiferum, Strain PAER-2" /LENGTH=150 /DNA_ID=CAMNT_0025619603 /DNA_START=53 /DNA_END=505 /DNA_ORIENTATION=-
MAPPCCGKPGRGAVAAALLVGLSGHLAAAAGVSFRWPFSSSSSAPAPEVPAPSSAGLRDANLAPLSLTALRAHRDGDMEDPMASPRLVAMAGNADQEDTSVDILSRRLGEFADNDDFLGAFSSVAQEHGTGQNSDGSSELAAAAPTMDRI